MISGERALMTTYLEWSRKGNGQSPFNIRVASPIVTIGNRERITPLLQREDASRPETLKIALIFQKKEFVSGPILFTRPPVERS
jgi:hypothetical protein